MIKKSSLKTTWQLVKPYWFSEDKFKGRLLLAVIISMSLGQVYISVLINKWNAAFYNALQNKQLDEFLHQLLVFTLLATCFIIIAVYSQYLNQMLRIRWRRWMTTQYLDKWLNNKSYYKLQVLYRNTDNPDQRIAEDIDMFVANTLSLFIGLLSAIVTLVSFVTILWGLSGTLTFTLLNHKISIPGYMLWAALIYSIIGTWITHKIGKSLVKLNFEQQRLEADFRFSMVRLRENAESIAFYKGEDFEKLSITEKFGHIIKNWWQIMKKQKQLNWFSSAYSQIAIIFPILVAAPRYFAGAIQLGGLMQTASAFGQVQGSLSWIIDIYTQFASWKATTDRLNTFINSISSADKHANKNIQISYSKSNEFIVKDLNINLPNGANLIAKINFTLTEGDRLILSGESGKGKTTLLRTIAGLWPYGNGKITLPKNAKILFVPQKPYLPIASLREVISYPLLANNFSDKELIDMLNLVKLPQLKDQLDNIDNWSQILSMGEQQKLAFARTLLYRPDILILDEATAAIDDKTGDLLYKKLLELFPNIILISVAHKKSLQAFHSKHIKI